MRYLLAADTGGTFTDIVVFDQRTKATQFGKPIGAMLAPGACNALVLLALICLQWRGV